MVAILNKVISWLRDGQPNYLYVLLFVAVPLGYLFIRHLQSSNKRDPREPPLAPSKIPYIGHLLGMIIYQADYLQMLASRNTSPIFAMKILSGEVVVITSPALVQAIFKAPRIFSFDKISIDAVSKVFGYTKRQMDILSDGGSKEREGDEYPLAKEITHGMHAALQNGEALLEMNTRALNRFAKFLDPIGRGKKKEKDVRLLAWVRHCFTIATMEAMYGPVNPVSEDPSLIQSLLEFEESMSTLYLNILPSITAPSGHRARLAFYAAFKKYYDGKHYLNASHVIKYRYDAHLKGGFNTDDLASFDLGLMVASTMNSLPAVFWLITHIYSSPSLLASLRAEIETIITRTEGRATMDVEGLNKKCPLLVSTWQETLRITDATVTIRSVTEDTLLADTYFLKKGTFIQIACGPMHTAPSIWGPTSRSFSAPRFLPSTTAQLSKDERKQRKMGYAPFGGGANLCPGRYFSSTEILGVVATLVAGFEITSAYGVALNVPRMQSQKMSVQVKYPVGDLDVSISRREGWEDVSWRYDFAEGADARKGDGKGEVFD